MAKKDPGVIDVFKGLWARGTIDDVPPDHFSDCLNTMCGKIGVGSRDSTSEYLAVANIKRMALYKPLPPFTGTNVPRILALKSNGDLVDLLLNAIIYSNPAMKDFGFVNFFGRCYISPSDGKIGLPSTNVQLYDGTGNPTRDAAGTPPTGLLTAVWDVTVPNSFWDPATWLISYALETSSGFITRPCVPFIGLDTFGGGGVHFTVPLGPAGTKARWLVMTKSYPLATIGPLGGPWQVERALLTSFFFIPGGRIGDNITTMLTIPFMIDESLIEDATFLLTQLETIPAGVGLIDYKGRMVSYGENSDPSLVRVSEIGEPEAFSETSGFLITDPSDSTGVRSATEFRNTLYIFKQLRGYMTEDNTLEASTWQVIGFDKSIGTEQHGIAEVMDAKGSSSDGFVLADLAGAYYFNGVFVEPELTYKIRDYWLRISQEYFYLTQVSLDPVNKRIYFLVALDGATSISHLIFGDYRDGMNPLLIKWHIWQIAEGMVSILTYTDFTNNIPKLVTRIATPTRVLSFNIDQQGNDVDAAMDTFLETALIRFGPGISHFGRLRVSGYGPATLQLTAFAKNKSFSKSLLSLTLPATPDREYAQLLNLDNEQCSIKVRSNLINEKFRLDRLILEGSPLWEERPR